PGLGAEEVLHAMLVGEDSPGPRAVRPYHPDRALGSRFRGGERDHPAVRRPCGVTDALAEDVRQPPGPRSIGVHDPYLEGDLAVAHEGDLATVWRPGRVLLDHRRAPGDVGERSTVGVHGEDVPSARGPAERQLAPVGRPGGGSVSPGTRGEQSGAGPVGPDGLDPFDSSLGADEGDLAVAGELRGRTDRVMNRPGLAED